MSISRHCNLEATPRPIFKTLRRHRRTASMLSPSFCPPMSRAICHDISCTTETPMASSTQITRRFPLSTASASCPNLCLSSAVMQPFPSRDLSGASTSSLSLPSVQLSSQTLRVSISDLAWWYRNKKLFSPLSVHDMYQLRRKACSSQESLLVANSQDSCVAYHRVQRVAHKNEVYFIPCDIREVQAHDGRDAISTEARAP